MKSQSKNLMYALLILIISLSTACKKENNDGDTKQGTANITISANGNQRNIQGPCGWATAMGTHYIGANDAENNLRVFEITFNIENPPSSTTTYTMVDSYLDEDPAHVTVSFTEMLNGGFIEWTAFDGAGNITLTVSGDKVTVNLNGIVLEPSSSNASPYDANGTLTGSLEFYR